MNIETRILPESKIELREIAGNRPVASGYAAIFNKRSENFGGEKRKFFEVVEPGAFASADMADVRLRVNHNGIPLARTKNGTLKLTIDGVGLRYEFEIPDTAFGNELLHALRSGNIDQSSFAFTVAEEGGDRIVKEDNLIVRYIKKITRLFDVGPVTIPAYADTTVSVRSLDAFIKAEADAAGERQRQLDKLKSWRWRFDMDES